MKIRNICILLFAIMLVAGCKEKHQEQQRPNILFIMTDDHAFQAISAYDSSRMITPNIDQIAKEGMLFTRGYVTNSLCAPSRATILTGKHCHLNGKVNNENTFDGSQLTFPKVFQANGYETAMIGKWHQKSLPTGFDFWKVLPDQGNYYNPEFETANGNEQITGYVTDIITDVAIDWLKNKHDQNKPFVMLYQHKAPHRPWWPSPKHFAEYSQKRFPMPATLFDDHEGRGTAAKTAEMSILNDMQLPHDNKIRPENCEKLGVSKEGTWFKNGFEGPYGRTNEEQRAQLDPILDSINDWFLENYNKMSEREKMEWKYERYMQDYLGCVASVDENIGRMLEYLKETGLDKNTIVVYTSDQGFYMGEHGWFDKRFMYEESFRTPLIIKWPDHIKPGTVCNELVQNLDFAPTFLDAAGIEIPQEMQGQSMVPLFNNPEQDFRDALYYHYYEYPSVHMVKRHYGVSTKRYKLIHFYYDVDEWELYDLKTDPNEMLNVYDDPAYSDVRETMHHKMDSIRAYYKDNDEITKSFLPSTEK